MIRDDVVAAVRLAHTDGIEHCLLAVLAYSMPVELPAFDMAMS